MPFKRRNVALYMVIRLKAPKTHSMDWKTRREAKKLRPKCGEPWCPKCKLTTHFHQHEKGIYSPTDCDIFGCESRTCLDISAHLIIKTYWRAKFFELPKIDKDHRNIDRIKLIKYFGNLILMNFCHIVNISSLCHCLPLSLDPRLINCPFTSIVLRIGLGRT